MNATSYSDINTYQRCPKKYEYAVVQNLQSKIQSVALFKGINAHDFAKEFFLARRDDASKTEAWARVLDYAAELVGGLEKLTFEDEQAEAAVLVDESLKLIGRYVEQYAEDWEILHVEEEFIIMLDNGKVISFTPDLVVRDKDGYVWIIDHKTTSRMPDGNLPFGDMQSLLYFAGVQALYPELKGFIFNRLRKKMPTEPRLVKTGTKRVAYLKNIDTTYVILRDFLTEVAPELLGEESHQKRLAELRDAGDRFFWSETVIVTESMVQGILSDVTMVLHAMDDAVQHQSYPRHLLEDGGYKSCRKCPFSLLCRSELEGLDTTTMREQIYEARSPKNPYEEEDE